MEKKSLYIKTSKDGIEQSFPSEAAPAIIGTYTYNAQRMGAAPTITATLMHPSCLDDLWTKKEYVEFNGEKYYVDQVPSSSKSNEDERYKHEITFVSERVQLENTFFLDVVTDDTESLYKDRYRSNSTKVVFYGDIKEFVARLNDSMKYSGLDYNVVIDEGITSGEKNISFESKRISECLQSIYNDFELPYYFTGKTIHVGFTENVIYDTLKYGETGGALSISKENANIQIVDRITGVGSNKNLPFYYPNDNARAEIKFETDLNGSFGLNIDADVINSYVDGSLDGLVLTHYYKKNDRHFSKTSGNMDEYDQVPVSTLSNCTILANYINRTAQLSFDAETIVEFKISNCEGYATLYNSSKNLKIHLNDGRVITPDVERKITSYSVEAPEWVTCSLNGNKFTISSPYTIEYGDFSDTIVRIKAKVSIKTSEFSLYDTPLQNVYSLKVSFYNGFNVSNYVDIGYEDYFKYVKNGEEKRIESSKSGIYTNVTVGGEYYVRLWQDDSQKLPYSNTLMPSIYRESKGKERFYNAVNDKYKYDDENFYKFNNLYEKGLQHEAFITFDDIYPTIKNIKNSSGLLLGEVADVSYDQDDSDALKYDSEDKNNADFVHSYFYIKLNIFDGEYGFNLFKQALESEKAKIIMTSGACAPCEFEIGVSEAKIVGDHFEFENPVQTGGNGDIVQGNYEEKVDFNNIIPTQQDTSTKSVWIALKKENSTFGEVMPNVTRNIKVKKGDKFVLTGINMPKTYILDAENRLENALIKHMKENNDEKFNFSVIFSRIFLAEHEDISNKLNENARINIEYNGQTHLLYVTNYSCKADDNILYEISVELAENVSVQQNQLRDTISEVAGDMVDKKWEGVDVFAAGQKFFIRKDIEDSAKEYIVFKKGLGIGTQYKIDRNGNGIFYKIALEDVLQLGEYIKNISGGLISSTGVSQLIALQILSNLSVSGNSSISGDLDLGGNITIQGNIRSGTFSTGALGSGFFLGKDELTGDTYFEIDRMLVRKAATFIDLIIQKIQHVGGQIILTPASMKCDSVAEIRDEDGEITAYRCFLNSSDGNTSVENQFVAGDQARAQTFNVKEGVNENVKNTYYWRLVTGVGDNYIDLSKTDCDAGSTVPAAGDEIVQLGNRNDVARQAAIILSAYGNDAPYFKMYRGINSYKLEGKEFVNLSREDVMIISDNIKLSTGETVKEYINGAVGDVQSKVDEVSGKVEDAVERLAEQQNYIAALQKIIEDLQDQVDGVIESHYGKTDPTTSNYPANEWTTEEQKQAHSNDTYTNLSTGKSWKWVKDGDTWKWNAITDTATEKALAAAAKAQDTADGKRRVFVSQPTTGQAYDVGDLWVNATYGETYKNDLLRCKSAKKENEAFSISHWELASRYTDDTKANEAAEAAREAAEAANAAQEAADEAAATAGEAKTEAQAANTELDNLKSDGTISPVEKTALKQQHADIKAEHGQITAEAGKYSISVTDYEAAYKKADAALTKYTASTPEYITVESDYSDISAYYSKRQTILDTIAAKAKEASDAAKKAADDAAAKAEEAAESASEAAQKAIEAKTAADNAATAAKNAQTDADEANSMLSDIANDNKLTAQEKQQTKKEWDVIVSEKPKNDASADKFGVSKTAYGSAYTALSTYITPLLSDLSSTSNITGTEFRAKFKAYYDARTDLLNAISAKAKELADNAQEAADAAAESASQAIDDAAVAKNAADKAQADVDAEKERMDDWAADGKFSPSEKKQLKEELARIDGDKTQVTDGYTKYGLGTPTAYNTAYTNYRAAINGVVSSSSETVAIPSDFATKRTAYYTQKSAALTAISDAAKAYADKVVAGIEVGGRNILMETNQGKKRWYANTNEGTGNFVVSEWVDSGVKGVKIELIKKPSSWCIFYYNLIGMLDLLEANTTYMLSFDMLSNISSTLSTTIMSTNTNGKLSNSPSFSFEANKRKHVVLKLVTNDLQSKNNQVLYFPFPTSNVPLGYICIKNIKLEKGNAATSWTPAIEDVNGMIEDAQKAADDAAEAAKNAQADATNANKELANIKSDNLISPIEKTALKQQQADIRSEYGEITANASRYAVSTTTYKSAYDLANAALTKYTASSPEYITVGSDYANISAYYDARKTILDAIAAAAKKAADDATNKANQAVEDAARAGHYYLDLDNDGGPVSCDASGNVTGGFPSSKATVYYGTEPDTGWAFTGAFSGCSGSVNSSTGQITVTGVSADMGTVTVTAKKSGKTDLSAVFSVYKVKAGADGADGTNGVGIKSITNKYAVSASNTTAPTSWSDTVPTMTTTNRYLWNYEIVTYTNSTTSETKKRVIGAYGNTGNTGATGATGVGIKSITEYYLASSASSGVTTSTSGWTTSVQATSSSKKYLWNYEVVTYTNDTKYTSSPVIIGTHGDDGADGKGIKSTAVTYQVSTSGTTPPTGTWSGSIPSVAANQYLWTRTVITYTDNTTSTSYSVGKMGANGAPGKDGADGKPGADGDGIVSVSNTYQIGSSGTTAPTGSWSSTVPSPQKGKYLWTKTVTTYKKSDPTTVYSVSYYGTDGTAAKYVRVAGDQVFIYTNNFSGNPTPTSITLTATLTGTSGYQWSYKQAGQTSFTNISGATSQTYALAHNNSTVWGSAKSVTIRCTSGGVYDEMTIAKVSSGTNGTNGKDGTNGTNGKDGAAGKNGADAYTIILDNESHAFQGTTSAAIAASTKCEVIAYKGATRVAATIGTITGAPSGMSTSISSNGTTSASFTVSVTSSLTTGQGVLTVPITVDGKSFTKNFSFSVAFKGNTGATGATGVGIKSITEYYLASSASSGVTTSTSGWTTSVQATSSSKKYLWNYEVVTYTNDTKYTSSPVIIGTHGDDGADGKGIKSTAVTYQVSTSGTTPPTGTWSGSIPSVAANQYLWTRTVITYTDNTTSTSYSVGKMGANGAPGKDGADGKPGADGDGIVSVSNTYQIGSSGTTAPTGSWSSTVPSPQKGKYLWTKTVTTYKKSDPTTVYSVSYYGTDGTAAKYVRVAGDQVFIYTNNFSGNPTPTSITLTATLTGTSGYQWSYKQAGQTSFTNISGATSQTYALAHNNSTVWGSAKSVTIRCTSGGVYDEMTIAKVSSGTNGTNGKDGTNGTNGKDGAAGKNGADAYTIILDNESHAFQGTTSAAIAASTKCEVIAYKGATRVAATIGTITGAPSGMSTSISSNGTTSASFTVSVTSSLTTGQGVLTVPITVDGKSFTKNFSFSVAFKGNTGATGATGPKGDDAVFYIIETDVRIVKKSWDNKLTPTSVTCTKYKQTGSNARATTTEKTLKYQRVGTDSSVQTAASGSSVTVSPTSTTTSIKFWLYDGSTIIDRDEIPVVGDAVDVYTKVHAKITAAEGEIGLLSTKVTTVTDSVTGLEKEVETNTAEIKSAKGQISSTASQVSSLGTRVSTVEQTASSLKTTVQGIQGDVSTLEQTTSKISLKVDSIWPDNIFPDGSFENGGLANRNLSNCTVSIDTSSHIHGSKSLKIQCVTGNSWVYVGRAQIPVVSGKVYTIVMWIRATSTFTESGGATGAYFSKNDQLELAGFTAFQPQFTSAWTRKAYKVTAPSGSNYLVLRLGTAGQTASRTLYFDSIMVFEGDLTGSLPSGFVEGKHDGELATGIDVINKKITVTSDQFVIQNNDGEVTASVDADGVLKIGSGEFSGYMKTVPQVDPNNNSVTVTRDVLKKGGFFCFPTRNGSSRGTVALPTSGDYLGTHLYIYSGSSVQTSGAKISYNGVETYTRLVVSTSCTYVELVAVPNSADAAKWHSYQTGASSTVPDIVWLLLVPGGATYTASGTVLTISRA